MATKTIILVHKEFLMNQWIERIADFLPSARVGQIQANKLEIEGKDIVIGMIQTLFSRDCPTGTFDSFGLTIIDEVHHIGSEMFSRTLLKIVTPYILGISATVERKDKLTKVLYMYIGPKIYSEERSADDAVTVHGIYYKTSPVDDEFNETEYDFRGQPKYSTMITKLCNYGPRSDFIVRVLADTLAMYCHISEQSSELNGQVMILSHNRSLLTYLYKAIEHRQIASVGFYVGGMKEKDLKQTEEKQVVLATYSMAAEALDIKTLSILIMATPKKDIEQSVGRILRIKHKNPIVIDIVDPHSLFQNQWSVRKRFYKKCNYNIVSIDSTQYKGMDLENGWKTVISASSTSAKSCINVSRDDDDDDDDDNDDDDGNVLEEKKEKKKDTHRIQSLLLQSMSMNL
jgi:superfamily II DNA or RNA helicase